MYLDTEILLTCPICKKQLIKNNSQLNCETGHTFDVARQGYVNLLPAQQKKSKDPGDSKDMISARQRFLDDGVYQPVSEKLNEILTGLLVNKYHASILDAGCGEGYYLNRFIENYKHAYPESNLSCIGLDISKPAIISAAKRNKNITWVVGSNKSPPVTKHSVDIALCMFGFIDLEVMAKVVKPDGYLILVDPGREHLLELRNIIYSFIKDKKSKNEFCGFNLISEESAKFNITLQKNQISDLMIMTPHLYRASKQGKEKAMNLSDIELTVDVEFRILQPNSV